MKIDALFALRQQMAVILSAKVVVRKGRYRASVGTAQSTVGRCGDGVTLTKRLLFDLRAPNTSRKTSRAGLRARRSSAQCILCSRAWSRSVPTSAFAIPLGRGDRSDA
jgi:hypothetical protein